MATTLTKPQMFIFLAVLLVGISVRIIGLNWGLSSNVYVNEPPFHPDELTTFKQSYSVFSTPDQVTFTWGGALYYKTAFWVRQLSTSPDQPVSLQLYKTIVSLRSVNILYTVISFFCLFLIAIQLHGIQAALLASSLFMFFPAHVLSSHYARPDVLFGMLSIISLLCSIKLLQRKLFYIVFLASFFSGLSVSTMSWGIINFVPTIFAWLENKKQAGPNKKTLETLFLFLSLASGGLIGYLAGSVESIIFPEAFLHGMFRATGMHQSQFAFPWLKLGPMAFFAFGLMSTLAAWAGFSLLLLKRPSGWLTLSSLFVTGVCMHGFQQGALMRYVLTFSPLIAIMAAYALHYLISNLPLRYLFLFPLAVIIFNLQLSLGYVIPMHFSKDIRYETADWLMNYIERNNQALPVKIGVTQSFLGDFTFQPRFPASNQIQIIPLMLKPTYNSMEYMKLNLDYIIFSDNALQTISGETAPVFLRHILQGDEYQHIRTITPPRFPFSLSGLITHRKPHDLLYIRPSFIVFARNAHPQKKETSEQ